MGVDSRLEPAPRGHSVYCNFSYFCNRESSKTWKVGGAKLHDQFQKAHSQKRRAESGEVADNSSYNLLQWQKAEGKSDAFVLCPSGILTKSCHRNLIRSQEIVLTFRNRP